MSNFLEPQGDQRYSVTEWNSLAASNPAEHRAAYEEGRVDLSPAQRAQLRANHDAQKPLGFTTVDDGMQALQAVNRRSEMSAEERAAEREPNEEPTQMDEAIWEAQQAEAEARIGRIDYDAWKQLSAIDPAAAREFHANGLVDWPSHIAANLAANRAEHQIGR